MAEKMYPFRKEFIKVKKTRRPFRLIEVPFDYQLGAVLVIDGYDYPIQNIWTTTSEGYAWSSYREGQPIYFTEEQVLNSMVKYTKLKD